MEFLVPMKSRITPQYGHSLVLGTGGKDSLLFTRMDLAWGASTIESAIKAWTAVCRAVVAYVLGAEGSSHCFGVLSVAFVSNDPVKCTAETLSDTLGS